MSGSGALRNIHRPEAAEKSLETRRTVRETSYWLYESAPLVSANNPFHL